MTNGRCSYCDALLVPITEEHLVIDGDAQEVICSRCMQSQRQKLGLSPRRPMMSSQHFRDLLEKEISRTLEEAYRKAGILK